MEGSQENPQKLPSLLGLAAARGDPVKRRHNRKIAQQRWRVEAAFSRTKRWRVLAECYRHELRRRKLWWSLGVFLYNLDIVCHPLSP